MRRMYSRNQIIKLIDEEVKPIYYHPIYIIDEDNSFILSCVILNNSSTAFTWETFKAFVEDEGFSLVPATGSVVANGETIILSRLYVSAAGSPVYAYGTQLSDGALVNAENITTIWENLFETAGVHTFNDYPNRIN